ncbi:protein of unknown function [Pseudomonas sp. JV241A]|nr:protein of unknown function [Pseudomonas sp. JV241A]
MPALMFTWGYRLIIIAALSL